MICLGKVVGPLSCSVASDSPDLSRFSQALQFCFRFSTVALFPVAIIRHRLINIPFPKDPLLHKVRELLIPYPRGQLDLWTLIDPFKVLQTPTTGFFNQEKNKDECDDVEDGENPQCSSCVESMIDLR